jgi:integrase
LTEVISLTAGDLSVEGETVFYSCRGKGGKTGRRELPRPAYEAIRATLSDAGKELGSMSPSESLWQAGTSVGGITSGTFYGRFRRYLAEAGLSSTGLHILRHTAGEAAPRCRRVDRGGQLVP